MKAVFSTLAWFIGSFANIYFILRWFSGDKVLLVRLCNYFLPWLGVLVAINLILSTLKKRWILSAFNMPPLALISAIYAPLFLNCTCDTQPGSRTLKVMSYNVHQYNRDMPAAAALIKRETPDILLLQEIEAHNFQVLARLLRDMYADGVLKVAYNPNILQAVLGRFPVEEIESSAFKNRLQKAAVATPYGRITVLNIHSYKFGWDDRHRRMETLIREDVVPETGPLILGGDFNTTEQSETYHFVRRFLNEAHWEVGCGLGFSYPARLFFFSRLYHAPAVIRIDHVFYDKLLTPIRAYTLEDSGGSDHYPIVAELRLQD